MSNESEVVRSAPPPARTRSVVDDGQAPTPGQLGRTAFLDAVEATVQSAVDAHVAPSACRHERVRTSPQR